jgi:hypothetical protein
LVALPVLVLGYGCQRNSVAQSALYNAGFGEFTFSSAKDAPCSFGETASVFVAQGREKPETSGYLCAPLFGAPRLYLITPSQRDRVDWH